MNTTTISTAAELNVKSQNMIALECERKRQIEETKRWISAHALKKLRQAWRH